MSNQVYAALTFMGIWMLYIFPFYQGVMELPEQQRIVDKFKVDLHKYPKVSKWYWLVPPIKISKEKQCGISILKESVNQETESHDLFMFFSKATAWFYIAIAGIFNGIVATKELVNAFLHHDQITIALLVDLLMTVVGGVYVRYRMSAKRRQKMAKQLFN